MILLALMSSENRAATRTGQNLPPAAWKTFWLT